MVSDITCTGTSVTVWAKPVLSTMSWYESVTVAEGHSMARPAALLFPTRLSTVPERVSAASSMARPPSLRTVTVRDTVCPKIGPPSRIGHRELRWPATK